MEAGDPVTRWRRFEAAAIVIQEKVATQLHLLIGIRLLIDLRLLPAQYRLFRRIRVLAVLEYIDMIGFISSVPNG